MPWKVTLGKYKIWQTKVELDTILLGLAGILLRNYLVKEAGAKKGATAVIYVFIVCLNASALKNTKPVPA